jgi:hypothetical protein
VEYYLIIGAINLNETGTYPRHHAYARCRTSIFKVYRKFQYRLFL